MIGHIVKRWGELGAGQIAVVHAGGDAALEAELERVGVQASERIVNPQPERGMFSSIQCAARWPGWRAEIMTWVLVLGDQPQLSKETLQQLIVAGRDHPDEICMPSYEGRGRHPVLMAKRDFKELATSSAATLKDFLGGRKQAWVAVNDAGLAMDIDTPEAYERALRYSGNKA